MTIQKIFHPISIQEIQELRQAKQIFSDCYLVSTINSFTRTQQGQKVLQNNIQKAVLPSGYEYKIRFNNIKGSPEDVFVSQEEIENIKITERYAKKIGVDKNIEQNKTLNAIELAMGKLIEKYPSLKDFFNKLAICSKKFEYNSPSRFMKIFTGKTPIALNEQTFRLSLNSKEKEARALLNQISANGENHNFISGTSFPDCRVLDNWHCYVIENFNPNKNKITLFETRTHDKLELTFQFFIDKFKFITGFFPKDLQ